MVRPWTKNDKHDYEHLEQRIEAEREREGHAPVAAEAGESRIPFEELSKHELYEQAQELDSRGYSRMTKKELRAVLRAKG